MLTPGQRHEATVFERLLEQGAVLVSYRPLAEPGQPCVFRFAQGEVAPGDRLFYIAGQRLRPESLGAAA